MFMDTWILFTRYKEDHGRSHNRWWIPDPKIHFILFLVIPKLSMLWKPMVNGSRCIGRRKKSGQCDHCWTLAQERFTCKAAVCFEQGRMLANIVAGVEKSLALNKKNQYVLLVSSDIPTLKPEMVDCRRYLYGNEG
jgi:hypothetical protein